MNPTTTVASARRGLSTGLRRVIDDADNLLSSAVDSGDQSIDALRDQFAGQLRRMRAQLEDLEDSAIHRVKRAARSANHRVHENPYSVIGVAAGVGLLVGLLAARRH